MTIRNSYRNNSSIDFLYDELFWLWITDNEQEIDIHWKTFLVLNPEKFQDMEEARKIIKAVNAESVKIPEQKIKALWEKIHNKTIAEQH